MYQALLHTPTEGDGSSGLCLDGLPAPAADGAEAGAAAAEVEAAQPGVEEAEAPRPVEGSGRADRDGRAQRRRQNTAGRWTEDEVAELIDGVARFKTSWAQIYDHYVKTGRINMQRTQASRG